MSIDIVRMRYRVRKALGIIDENDPDLPETDIDEYLNLAFWEVQDKLPFREKEVTETSTTVAGTRQYTMPTPIECLRSLAVVDPTTGEHSALEQITTKKYDEIYTDDSVNDNFQDIPRAYYRESNYAVLWPTPDDAYTLIIRRNTILADLSDANPDSPLPQIWTEILIYGAVWRAQFDFGNRAGSRETQKFQTTLIASTTPTPVKELGDTSRAGLQVLGRDYDQGYGSDDERRWRDR